MVGLVMLKAHIKEHSRNQEHKILYMIYTTHCSINRYIISLLVMQYEFIFLPFPHKTTRKPLNALGNYSFPLQSILPTHQR